MTLREAKRKLENYCAYQDRCHKEVIDKLKRMRMIPEAIDQIVTQLIEDNFLNEGNIEPRSVFCFALFLFYVCRLPSTA